MKPIYGAALAALTFFAAVAALAQSGPPVRIRGTIDAIMGQELAVTSRSGEKFKLALADKTGVSLIVPAKLADINDNSYIGTAAMPQADGSLVALEVHIFPEAMRGTGDGSRPFDLKPQSTMTNGTAAEVKVAGVDGRTLIVKYKDGAKKLMVPKDAPVVTYAPGDKAMLKAGGHVIIFASKRPDGSLQADRIALGKDGLVPPM
jgi:hypothetical protein